MHFRSEPREQMARGAPSKRYLCSVVKKTSPSPALTKNRGKEPSDKGRDIFFFFERLGKGDHKKKKKRDSLDIAGLRSVVPFSSCGTLARRSTLVTLLWKVILELKLALCGQGEAARISRCVARVCFPKFFFLKRKSWGFYWEKKELGLF